MVILTKYPPYIFLVSYLTIVPLMLLKFCRILSINVWLMTSCWFPLARGDLYSCEPIRSIRKLVISKWGFPSKAGILFLDATICAKNEPLLFPTNISGFSWLHNLWIKSIASCGCRGKSGLKTVALPLKYSFKARTGIHVPDAKKP